MITGQIKSYEESYFKNNFPEEFARFLELIYKAELTLNEVEVVVGEIPTTTPSIQFNSFKSTFDYKFALDDSYEDNIIALPYQIDEIYQKTDKLNLLNKCITELKNYASLLKENNAEFTHKDFVFINNAKSSKFKHDILQEKSIQEYYHLMNLYINKMLTFLEHKREDIRAIAQKEFPIPKRLLPSPTDSTIENPIKFFESILQGNLFQALINDFASDRNEDLYDIKFDDKSLTLTYNRQDDEGEWTSSTIKFSDRFQKLIIKQVSQSQNLIQEHIEVLKTGEQVSKFLQLTVNNLRNLLQIINTKSNSEYIQYCKPCIVQIGNHINLYYSSFFNPTTKGLIKEFIKEADTLNKSLLLPLVTRHPYAFNLLRLELKTFTSLAWSFLEEAYIHSDYYSDFINLFTGEKNPKDLRKIPWQKEYNQKFTNKKSLFYLFTQLQEQGHIEKLDPTTLKERLMLLFCNKDNTPFDKSIHQNYLAFKTNFGKHDKIDSLLSALATKQVS